MMTIQRFGLILLGLTLGACAGADYPGFVDATVEVTTGVDLQEGLENYTNEQDGRRQPATQTAAAAAPQAVVRDDVSNTRARASVRRSSGSDSPFANWSAVVVAGDHRAATGADTDAFDNARREVASQLRRIGFEAQNMSQFSMRPTRYQENGLQTMSFAAMQSGLHQSRRRARDGCLVYMTSHGFPAGFAVGNFEVIAAAHINEMLDEECGDDPTILIVSSCYSGVFAQGDLAKPNRFIMTASRSDRTSFGCGEGDRYPYFDACVLEVFPQATNFVDVARNTRACVEAREQAGNLSPPSAPQIYMGPEIRELMMSPFVIQQSDQYGPSLSGT